jgi:hypothetical protein
VETEFHLIVRSLTQMHGTNSRKSEDLVSLSSNYTRALTHQNFWQSSSSTPIAMIKVGGRCEYGGSVGAWVAIRNSEKVSALG